MAMSATKESGSTGGTPAATTEPKKSNDCQCAQVMVVALVRESSQRKG